MKSKSSVIYHICSHKEYPVPHGVSGNFYLSRQALLKCLHQRIPENNWNDSSLEIVNHHYMKEDSRWRVSLSHTRQVGAALLCHCDEADSVGIDIEYSHRLVSNKAVRYFKNALDDWNYNTSEGILWAWSLKEAAFKALSPIKEKRLLLKDIWIDEKKFGLDSAPLGIFKRQFNSSLSLHIALAFIG